VLKLYSQTITHKSDVGGVQLNLTDDEAVRRGFAAIAANLARLPDSAALEGVTVQPMVREKGYELIVGSNIDAQFGPVILFGAGGVMVEILKDTALALPPLNRTLARRLMERTQIFHALQGVRGQRPVNLDVLEALLVHFSYLLCDFQEIAEIDVNPLLASPERVIALDARVLLCPPDLPEERRPRLAIHPYPNQYVAPHRLADGTELLIRPIRPEDEPLLIAFHATHSEHTIRMRFFSMVKTLSRDSLIRLCHLDYNREMALVAVHHDSEGKPHLVGVSRYYLNPQTNEAEFAVVVGDAWQGRGLGWDLMQRLLAVARARGIDRMTGLVLRENAPMLKLAEDLGFEVGPTGDAGVMKVVMAL
jgi:acetyltransferase